METPNGKATEALGVGGEGSQRGVDVSIGQIGGHGGGLSDLLGRGLKLGAAAGSLNRKLVFIMGRVFRFAGDETARRWPVLAVAVSVPH